MFTTGIIGNVFKASFAVVHWLIVHLWHLGQITHYHVAHRPHHHFMKHWKWYKQWHEWNYHRHIHSVAASAYILAILVITLVAAHAAFASDLVDTFDFTTPSDYTMDDGIETSGTTARLKAQNYSADGNTVGLYHLDEVSGSTGNDDSGNTNNAVVNGTTNWVTGNLNNAFSFNGTTALTAADSASLSLTSDNTLEAWTKFNSTFTSGSHDHDQAVIDKGAYKLYYDHETGRVTYELANAGATSWTQQAGSDIKNSWDTDGKFSVNTQVSIGSNVYAGLGNGSGDAEVWKWNGSAWSQIGGEGKNSSWPTGTYENVVALAKIGTTLYAGLGSSAGDAEVWSCDTSSNCTSWNKIGGDSVNSSWASGTFEEVSSMTTMGGNLYAGLGNSTNDARVYMWNGSTWTWVGGFGVGGPYNAFPSGYEAVSSLSSDGTNVYAGFGSNTTDADVWKLAGTTWTQVGGDGTNSSWNTNYESVLSLDDFGGNLYAGIGLSGGDAEIWKYNGTTWTQVGGDTLNSSWDNSSYEGAYALADDGTNLYAGLGDTAGDNEVWKFNGTSWSQIGGDGLNSGFGNTHNSVRSLVYASGTLYAGLESTGTDGEVWSFNGSAWSRIGGRYINKSWGFFNLQDVESMTVYGAHLYAGTGTSVAGNALIWKFDGSTWQIVGGQGINSSWPADSYESVTSMISYGGRLVVGLGTGTSDAEVWSYNGSVWSKIGGDSVNSSWGASYEEVGSLAVNSGNLYAGLGNSTDDAEVWQWNGTSWTKIGGDSLNSSWGSGYERVSALTVFNGEVYAGLGTGTGDAEIWAWNGSAWSKIGGDGISSSWNTNYEDVGSLAAYNGRLYAGLGLSTGDAEVWVFNGSSWSQIGGDGLNSSWATSQYEQVKSLVTYNGNLYAGLGNSSGNGEVWEYTGSGWSRIGGNSANGSWAAGTIETVHALANYHGKLYAGLGDSANSDAQVWSYGNNGYVQSTTSSQDTAWHHVAATYDGATMSLYIDGVLDAQTSIALGMPNTAHSLLLGSTIGAGVAGNAQGYFEGTLDEIRISNVARTSFTVKPYATTPQAIFLSAGARPTGVWHWDTLSDTETANGGTITYRLSDNGGSTWQYWNGSGWVASADTSLANSIAVVNAHIATFPVTFKGLVWEAILAGNGDQQVTLNDVTLQSTSDSAAPDMTGVTIDALKANGGSVLNAGDWTNGASPYFSWNDAFDASSGIKGYCAYLGTDNTADPVTARGILGGSPVDTGSLCAFLVGSAALDTAIAGYLDTPPVSQPDPYFLTIKAMDNAGNISSTAVQFNFHFDNSPPVNPAFISSPSGFVSDKTVDLTWPTVGPNAATDAGSGVAGLQYRIGSSGTWYGDSHTGAGDINDLLTNDGLYTTQDPPDFANLVDGTNTIYFRTWDVAGNVTTTYVTAAIKINSSLAPTEPQNLIATPTSNTTNSFAFSWDPPATFSGFVGAITYCYTVNILPSDVSCSFTSPGVTNLPAGPYATQPGTNTMYVVAKDETGNINYATYSSVVFSANTTAPGVPINMDIVDVSVRSTSNWRLAITWDTPSDPGDGVVAYKIYRSTDGNNFALAGTSTSTAYIDSGLTQQLYYYKVAACDSTGNCGAFGSTVSATPTGRFTSPALLVAGPTVSNITTKHATVTWSTDRLSDSAIAIGTSSGQYSPSEISNPTQTTSHQIDLSNLVAGTTYYIRAKWTDADNNTGQSQEVSFTTAPAPSLKEIVTLQIGLSNGTISFTSKNAVKVSVLYGQTDAFGGIQTINTSPTESTYSINLHNLIDGTKYFFKLVAYDSEDTAYESTVFSFTTQPRPRITNLTFQPIPGEPTSTQMVTWHTNVPSTSQVTYGKVGQLAIDLVDSKLVIDHQIIIRDLEDDSQYTLTAQSRDKDGNLAISDPHQFHTDLDTRPPKISSINVESSVRGTGAEARGQVIVSWRTDEPGTSQVAFGEGSGLESFNSRTAEDTDLAFEHVIIVSDLPTSKVYTVQPISRDKTGNAGKGETQPAIIGRASDSVLTIVLDTLRKIFGF